MQRSRVLNAVPLQNAVLCAECEVVSDSPHDVCMVCGSRSLFNIAGIFGGKLPRERVSRVAEDEVASREYVLSFPKPHRRRRRATSGPHQLAIVPFSGLALNSFTDFSDTDFSDQDKETNPQGASRPETPPGPAGLSAHRGR